MLLANGTDAAALKTLQANVKHAGEQVETIALKVSAVTISYGKAIKTDGLLSGQPSVTVDACAVILLADAYVKLKKDGAAVQWVMDAFGHFNAIDQNADAKALLAKAAVEVDEGFVDIASFAKAATKRYWEREPNMRMLA